MKKIINKVKELAKGKSAIIKAVFAMLVFFVLGIFISRTFLQPKPTIVAGTRTFVPVTTYVDRNGTTHSEIKTDVVSKEVFKQQTDSYKRLLKGRAQINTVTEYIQVHDTVFRDLAVTKDGDTLSIYKKDNYIDASAKINSKTMIGEMHIAGIDTITYIDYTKKHLFKANERTINLSGKSPYNSYKSGRSITLKEPKPILVLDIQGGWNPFNQKFYGGIGIGVPIITLKSRK